MNHPLRLHTVADRQPIRRDSINPPAWPSYTGTSQLVGTTPSGRATIYVDPSLGAPGLQNAQDLLNDADRVASANDALFGTTGGPVRVPFNLATSIAALRRPISSRGMRNVVIVGAT